jgi:hypothetical protein
MSTISPIEITAPTAHEIAIDANDIFDGLAQGYCVHGTYVGGCGIDWMCGACESGEDRRDFVQVAEDRLTNWAWADALNGHARNNLKAIAFLARHYESDPVKALNEIAEFMADYQAERKEALARRSA